MAWTTVCIRRCSWPGIGIGPQQIRNGQLRCIFGNSDQGHRWCFRVCHTDLGFQKVAFRKQCASQSKSPYADVAWSYFRPFPWSQFLAVCRTTYGNRNSINHNGHNTHTDHSAYPDFLQAESLLAGNSRRLHQCFRCGLIFYLIWNKAWP